ncbi:MULTISPECIES: CDP-diacylglycerol--glycerol-3-phosphate 3-phosphatidyltransferase [unclassified Brevundimonas]|jgi:CDP-diacylglycerol--glycerol-3-phosphate 3-phosphatidyltransferase|uniref:CDP-diacylglycerol--glycerol-3-phosphate 3-phosphatidyltransferase n=1 Tax=unclassified Brevundimonas TaxID=2622653 RepID=UPI000E997F0B|nr:MULTISPECIES: CDP-diacylglycerol--glycerol-3-phosphate 3-phosphatidyltransferase [unclassified Brevundimonas]MCK6103687.1 CDP-diacylglycerol--glycerol-3-phosphate 3-phosphatidyltransferase [Brevundimonas sp. EYE_349]HBI19732.1 CDP-diacylglycerol--glycerol-3-phosphate 3-phosphatidyltransferase [Brevundimonas sp.]
MTAHRANPIPNILTGARLAAGVVMFLILAGATSGFPLADQWMSPDDQFALYRVAFWIFVIAASTDWIDGFLARRWNATTRWGAILDPIADKVLVTGAILGVLTSGSVPQIIIPCGLILFREFAVSALRETMAGRIELPVTLAAKWKTTLQLVALGCQLFARNWDGFGLSLDWLDNFQFFSDVLIWLAAIITLWTGWQYFHEARRQMRDL